MREYILFLFVYRLINMMNLVHCIICFLIFDFIHLIFAFLFLYVLAVKHVRCTLLIKWNYISDVTIYLCFKWLCSLTNCIIPPKLTLGHIKYLLYTNFVPKPKHCEMFSNIHQFLNIAENTRYWKVLAPEKELC